MSISAEQVEAAWLRDTAMNVMLATEVEEAERILSSALNAAASIPASRGAQTEGKNGKLAAALSELAEHLDLTEGAYAQEAAICRLAATALAASPAPHPVEEQEPVDTLPKLANTGRYLAEDNTGQWHYINHAGTWQGCPPPFSSPSATITDEMVERALPFYGEGGCSGLADYERREVVVSILEAALVKP